MSKIRRAVIYAPLFFALSSGSVGFAQSNKNAREISVEADAVEIKRPSLTTLHGNVRVITNNAIIKAQKASILTSEHPKITVNDVLLTLQKDVGIYLRNNITIYTKGFLYDFHNRSLAIPNSYIILPDHSNVLTGKIYDNGNDSYHIEDICFTPYPVTEQLLMLHQYQRQYYPREPHKVLLESQLSDPIKGNTKETTNKKLFHFEIKSADYNRNTNMVDAKNIRLKIYDKTVVFLPHYRTDLNREESKTQFMLPRPIKFASSQYGLDIPFNWRISDNHDLKLNLKVYRQFKEVDDRQVKIDNHLHYRYRYVGEESNGYNPEFSILGSVTQRTNVVSRNDQSLLYDNSSNLIRGHRYYVSANGFWPISKTTSLKMRYSNTSDPYYPKIHHGIMLPYQTNSIAIQDIRKNAFNKLELLSWTPMSLSLTRDFSAKIIPRLISSFDTSSDKLGGYFTINNQANYIQRDVGYSRFNSSSSANYHLPIRDKIGNRITIDASARGDIYNMQYNNSLNPWEVNNFKQYFNNNFTTWDYGSPAFNGNATRLLFNSRIMLSHMFIQQRPLYTLIVEPKFALFINNRHNNSVFIPNEDSFDIRLKSNNLFSNNHISGLDVVENANYAAYGLQYSYFIANDIKIYATIGQMLRLSSLNDRRAITSHSGFAERFSDYVYNIGASYGRYAEISHSARISSVTKKMVECNTDIGLSLIHDDVKVNIGHSYLSQQTSILPHGINMIRFSTDIRLTDRINFQYTGAYNLDPQNRFYLPVVFHVPELMLQGMPKANFIKDNETEQPSETQSPWIFSRYTISYDANYAVFGIHIIHGTAAAFANQFNNTYAFKIFMTFKGL